MTQNIAELGVKVKVSGDAELNSLGNTADKVGKKFSLLDKFINGSSLLLSKLKNNFINLKSATTNASIGLDNFEKILLKDVNAWKEAKKAAQDYNNVLRGVASTQEKTRKMAGDRGAAQANRFNSANFLAQFQDIIVTSSMKMNPFLIALQQGTQLQYNLALTKEPLKDFVAGLKSAFNVTGLLAIGLTGLVAAGIQMVNWVDVGKNALNGLASVFDWVAENADKFALGVGVATIALLLFNSKSIVTTIVNLTKLGATAVATGVKMAAAWIAAGGPVTWILTAIAGITTALIVFSDESENILKVFKEIANKVIGLFAAAFNTIVQGAKWVWQKLKSITGGEAPAKTLTDTLIETNMQALNKDYIGSMVTGIKSAATGVANKFREWSENLGKSKDNAKKLKTEIDKVAEAWKNINISASQKIEDLIMQRGLIGAGTYESTYVQTLNDLIRQAEGAGVDLTEDKLTVLKGFSETTAKLTEENKKLTESYNFARSTVGGFFSDMRKGLRDGESAWESFGNAVTNVLDKILDRIMDIGVDALFQAGRSAGWFTSGKQVYNSPIGPTMPGATPLTGAANGGVFSNGVYSSPTLFKFAKGGKFGVMGEAGPEAVMPLRRGPDGSLGVKADGIAGNVVVNVINNSNAQAKTEQRQTAQGTEIDVIIDEMVAEKLSHPGTSSNSALRAFNNRQLITR